MRSAFASRTFTPQCDPTPLLRARRRPRQARSQMTVASLLDATALVLLRRGYAACTTNLVAEVEYRRWPEGGLMQQASFKGFRTDKDARDVVKEDATTVR